MTWFHFPDARLMLGICMVGGAEWRGSPEVGQNMQCFILANQRSEMYLLVG
jgi:hypothetical protein